MVWGDCGAGVECISNVHLVVFLARHSNNMYTHTHTCVCVCVFVCECV